MISSCSRASASETASSYVNHGDAFRAALLYAYRKADDNLWSWFRPITKLGFSGIIKVGSCATTVCIYEENVCI